VEAKLHWYIFADHKIITFEQLWHCTISIQRYGFLANNGCNIPLVFCKILKGTTWLQTSFCRKGSPLERHWNTRDTSHISQHRSGVQPNLSTMTLSKVRTTCKIKTPLWSNSNSNPEMRRDKPSFPRPDTHKPLCPRPDLPPKPAKFLKQA
jgi:hypothetical protein